MDSNDDPWPPSDAKPGDSWGAYTMCEDGWWRLRPTATPQFSWRLDMQGIAHAIEDCDPMATMWITQCCRVIFGPAQTNEGKCQECLTKLRATQDAFCTDVLPGMVKDSSVVIQKP